MVFDRVTYNNKMENVGVDNRKRSSEKQLVACFNQVYMSSLIVRVEGFDPRD